MKKPWYIDNPELLEEVRASLRKGYPNLHLSTNGDKILVKGSFPVFHDGVVLDRYQIEIDLLPDYPNSVPVVREVGGRIPHTADRHINNKEGVACLFLKDEQMEICPPGTSLVDFLNGPIRNYFISQSLVELGQPWPFGEHAHGNAGRTEYYQEIIGTKDDRIIFEYLKCLSKPQIKGHWLCPCGSGQKIRHCHAKQIYDLKDKITPHIAKSALKALVREALQEM